GLVEIGDMEGNSVRREDLAPAEAVDRSLANLCVLRQHRIGVGGDRDYVGFTLRLRGFQFKAGCRDNGSFDVDVTEVVVGDHHLGYAIRAHVFLRRANSGSYELTRVP